MWGERGGGLKKKKAVDIVRGQGAGEGGKGSGRGWTKRSVVINYMGGDFFFLKKRTTY